MNESMKNNVATMLDFFLDVFIRIPSTQALVTRKWRSEKLIQLFDSSKLKEDEVASSILNSTPISPTLFSSSSETSSSEELVSSPSLPGAFPELSSSFSIEEQEHEQVSSDSSSLNSPDPLASFTYPELTDYAPFLEELGLDPGDILTQQAAVSRLSSNSTDSSSSSSSSISSSLTRPSKLYSSSSDKSSEVYSVLLWNDDINSFNSVFRELKLHLPCLSDLSQHYTTLVDEVGRATIFETTNFKKAIEAASALATSNLRVTIRPKRYVNREYIAATCLTWLITLVRGNAHHLTNDQRNSIRTLVCEALLAPWSSSLIHPVTFPDYIPKGAQTYLFTLDANYRELILLYDLQLKPIQKTYSNTRLFLMLTKDIDYWKQLRQTFKEFLVSMLLVDPSSKLELAYVFAEAYPILYFHTLFDPEPNHSVFFFGIQLFTSGVIALELVQTGFLYKLMLMLSSEFDLEPEDLWIPKNNGLTSLCHHFSYLIGSPLVQSYLANEHKCFLSFLSVLRLPLQAYEIQRKTGSHVEDSFSEWEEALNITIELASPMKGMGLIYKNSAMAISGVLMKLYLCFMETHNFKSFSVPKRNLLEEKFTIHNYLHYMLARLKPTPENLKDLETMTILKIMDAPLTSLVFYAQESTGLWIRNGHRIQLHECFYFESPLFHLTSCFFDLDFYLVQLAFRSLPSTILLPWILDRYGFSQFDSTSLHWPYAMDLRDPHLFIENRHQWGVLEAMLLCLIQLITDKSFSMSNKEEMQSTLIHFLAYSPKLHSQILECTSDDSQTAFSLNSSIEEQLSTLANMTPRSSHLRESAKYCLKKEFYKQVNPFYKRYSRNQRAFLDQVINEKKLPLIIPSTSIDPSFLIAHDYASDFFVQLLHEPELPETIIDIYFALFAILLHTPSKQFIDFHSNYSLQDQHPMIHFLEHHPKLFKCWLQFSQQHPPTPSQGYFTWVMQHLQQHAPHLFNTNSQTAELEGISPYSSLLVSHSEAKEFDSKKETALERQKQLIEQMKQQQLQFAANYANELASEFSDMEEENEASDGRKISIIKDTQDSVVAETTLFPSSENEPNTSLEETKIDTEEPHVKETVPTSSASDRLKESGKNMETKLEKKELMEEDTCIVCHRHVLNAESFGFLVRFEVSSFLKRDYVLRNFEKVQCGKVQGLYANSCGHLIHETCLPSNDLHAVWLSCPLCRKSYNAWIPSLNSLSSDLTFMNTFHSIVAQKKLKFNTFYHDTSYFRSGSANLKLTASSNLTHSSMFFPLTVLYTLSCIEIQLRSLQQGLSSSQLHFLRSLVHFSRIIVREHELPFENYDFSSSMNTLSYRYGYDPLPDLFYYYDHLSSWDSLVHFMYSQLVKFFPLNSEKANLLHVIFLRKCALLKALSFPSLPSPDLLSLDISVLASQLNLSPISLDTDSRKKSEIQNVSDSCNVYSIDHLEPYTLITLPETYEELLIAQSQFVCPKCKLTPDQVGVCLICERFVCLQSFCCMQPETYVGEGHLHKRECSGDVGLYLDLKYQSVLVLFDNYGKYLTSLAPYLDAYGDCTAHRGLRLGRPMKLKKDRYEKLTELWLKQELGNRVYLPSEIETTFGVMNFPQNIWILY